MKPLTCVFSERKNRSVMNEATGPPPPSSPTHTPEAGIHRLIISDSPPPLAEFFPFRRSYTLHLPSCEIRVNIC